MKSSGEDWENVKSCGGVETFGNDWYSRLRLSELSRMPRNADEAKAIGLARQALIAASLGNTNKNNELVRQIQLLNPNLSSCGLDYSSLNSEVMITLIKARVAIGTELRKIFLSGGRSERRVVFINLRACQMNFSVSADASLDCYLKLLPESAPNKEHAFGVIKEAAILTLLLEKNQNPPCFSAPDLSDSENENYQVGTFMSPLFDQNKEMSFDIHHYVCTFTSGGVN